MTKDELKPIDTSKYKITETGQVLKITKEENEMIKDKISMALNAKSSSCSYNIEGFTGIEVNGVRFSNIGEMLCYMNKQRTQLIKAKEIMREMLRILPKENIEGVYEITEEAEQFIREV